RPEQGEGEGEGEREVGSGDTEVSGDDAQVESDDASAAERSAATGAGNGPGGDRAGSDATGAAEPVRTEDVATLLFETDAGASGAAVISQVSAGRKNRLWLEVSAAAETFTFEQESPGALGVLRREEAAALPSDPE